MFTLYLEKKNTEEMDTADLFKQKIPRILIFTDEDRPISPPLPMDVVKENFNTLIPEILMFSDNERPISPIDPDSTESSTNTLSSMSSSDLPIDLTEKRIENTCIEDKNNMIQLLPSNLNFVGSSYSSKDKKHSFLHIGNDRFTCQINTENIFAFSLEKPKVNVSKEEACSINSDQISKQDKSKVFQEIESISNASIGDSLEKELSSNLNKSVNLQIPIVQTNGIVISEEKSSLREFKEENSYSEKCIDSRNIEPVGYTEEKETIPVKNKENVCLKFLESKRKKTISGSEEESAIKDKNSIEPVRFTEENKIIPVINKTDNIHLKSPESKRKKTISGSEEEVKVKNDSSSETCIGSNGIEPAGYTEEKKTIRGSEESAVKDKNSNIEPVRYTEENKIIPVINKTDNMHLKSPESKRKKTISGSEEESVVKVKNDSSSESCIGSNDIEPVGFTEEKKTIPVKNKENVHLKFLESKRKQTISVFQEESVMKNKNSNIEPVRYTEEKKIIPVINKTDNIHLKSPESKRKKTISGSEEESAVKVKNDTSSESCIDSIDIEPVGYTEEKKTIPIKNKENVCLKFLESKRKKTISGLEEESAIKDKNSNIEPVRYTKRKKVVPIKNKTDNIHLKSVKSKRKKKNSGSEEESAVKDQNNSSSESCIGSIDIKPVGYTDEKKNYPVKNKDNICLKSPESKRLKTNSGSEKSANKKENKSSPENCIDNNTEPVGSTEENKTISFENQTENIHLKSSESRKKKMCSASEEQSMVLVHPIISVLEEIKKVKKNEYLMKINDLFKAVLTALQDPYSSSGTKILTVIYNYICSSKLNPVVSFLIKNKCSVFIIPYEKAFVETLIKIEHDKETRLEGLLKLTMISLKNLILEKRHIQKTGSAAFCRIYTLICKSQKKDAVLKLSCDLIKSNHQFAAFLISNIIGTWKEIFIVENNSKDYEVLLLSAIAYGVQNRLCKNNSSETKILKTVFSKLLVATATENPSKAVQICIENLKNIFDKGPTENDFFFLEPIIIFSSIEGDKWSWENVVKPFLLPCLMEFANKVENERAFSILLELYVEIGLCAPEVSVGAMNALSRFFNMKNAYAYVKPTTAIFLTKLYLSKKATLFPKLLEWVKQNETNLQGTIVESTLKRLLISDEPYITINDICGC